MPQVRHLVAANTSTQWKRKRARTWLPSQDLKQHLLAEEDLCRSAPGLTTWPSQDQQMAADLLATTWEKLHALCYGPPQPEEPGLGEVLQTYLTALPKAVQDVVNNLTQPIPDTEKEIAQKLKIQVTDLKAISVKKTQLPRKLDTIKARYASMLQDMQDLQTKLTEVQQNLKSLSEQCTKAVNQSPLPEALTQFTAPDLPLPMAVETFVPSLGIALTDDQRSQLHGLLKRPSLDEDERSKRRKTENPASPPSGGQCG